MERIRAIAKRFGAVGAIGLFLLLPAPVLAQWNYETNDAEIAITGYTGAGGAVIVPDVINGFPVTVIAPEAFYTNTSLTSVLVNSNVTAILQSAFTGCTNLTSLLIPASIDYYGDKAFYGCSNLAVTIYPSGTNNVLVLSSTVYPEDGLRDLTSVTLSNGITAIGPSTFSNCTNLNSLLIPASVNYFGDKAFYGCSNLSVTIYASGTNNVLAPFSTIYPSDGLRDLTSVTLSNGITAIGQNTFSNCTNLNSLLIPTSITFFGNDAFYGCTNLVGVYFLGNAPGIGSGVFGGGDGTTVYYLPGSSGWGTTLGGRPTALWLPQIKNLGVQTNQFGFDIGWASGEIVVIDACTNLASGIWAPVGTNTLTGGSSHFSDLQWTNYLARFYRLRSP
jgi:hypothetical protein